MKILFVAMAESVHTARWLSQLSGLGWDLHLFPSRNTGQDAHPELGGVTLRHAGLFSPRPRPGGLSFRGVGPASRAADIARRRLLGVDTARIRAAQLARVVESLRPDVVHSMEIQAAGYLTLDARRLVRGPFPRWIVTNWGSDIYLFGRLPDHAQRIRDVLAACDCYSCECLRDVALAREFGFAGTVLPVLPNGGGFDLEAAARLRAPGPASARRLVMLKGYQHWGGRALVGLRALARCAEALAGYEVAIYSASPDVAVAAELFRKETGLPVTVVPKGTPHEKILALHGRARLSIGLSVSDAISTSLLEAIVMGSFPIQSNTACADEWVEDGRTGLLVPPDDPDVVEAAVRRALADDALVDAAAQGNAAVAAERLDGKALAARAAQLYREAAAGRAGR